MAKPDFGTATPKEISDGFAVAMRVADDILAINNPAVQNMVKELISLISIQEVGGKG